MPHGGFPADTYNKFTLIDSLPQIGWHNISSLSLPSEASNEFAASDQEYMLTSSLVGQQTLSNKNGASSIGIYFLKDGHHSEWAATISEEAKCPVALNSNSYNAEGGLALAW